MAPSRYVSETMALPTYEEERPFKRADLEFYGVNHSGSSFEARVFLNNPDADESTPLDDESGYAGSFYVFGHGGCFGDVGHCDIPQGPKDPFDRRPPHQLTPQKKTVIITEHLEGLLRGQGEAEEDNLIVTVVPVASESPVTAEEDLLRFERIALITYD